jgi:hypothetical protein
VNAHSFHALFPASPRRCPTIWRIFPSLFALAILGLTPEALAEGEAPAPAPASEEDEEEEEPETYDGPATVLGGRDDKIAIGGYGGVTVLGTALDKQAAVLVGGEAALLLDHRFALGLGGMGLANEVNGPAFSNGDPSALGFGYGGGIMRYHLLSERSPLALSLGALVGAGGLTVLRKVGPYEYEYEDDPEDVDVFFVAEPSIQAHLYLTRWMRLGLNGSYRYVHFTSRDRYTDSDLGGFAGGGHLQFGWF